VELTHLLLERGADATAHADDAVDGGYVEPLHLLPDGRTDGTAQSDEGWTQLQVAAAEGNTELTRQLPDRRADEATQADDDSVLAPTQVVAAEGVVGPPGPGLLSSSGIDAMDQAADGRTSTQVAVSEGYEEPASLITETSAVLTAQVSNELTLPNVTSAERQVESTRSLRQPGLDVTAHADYGRTPLRMGSQREQEDVARGLPNHGTETIIHDDQRWCRCIVQ